MLNASDSGEELDMRKSFLKGKTMTMLWNNDTNNLELENGTGKKHGYWSTITVVGGGKILSIITVYRIVNDNEKVLIYVKLTMSEMVGK